MPTGAEDWSWLAGIFEGEGTAGLRWAKKRHEGSARRAYLFVAIAQKETSMLEEVQRIVGYGKIYSANRKDGKPLFTWQVACRQARQFLETMRPFMRTKHKTAQVDTAITLDAEMRQAGTTKRRETLTICREKRWREYRAAVLGA